LPLRAIQVGNDGAVLQREECDDSILLGHEDDASVQDELCLHHILTHGVQVVVEGVFGDVELVKVFDLELLLVLSLRFL
jgi:hypothetical protein